MSCFTVPPHLTQIGASAFYLCNELKKLEFPKNSELQVISKFAFCETSIENVTFSPHITSIGESAFSNCSKLKKVEFSPDSELREISELMFFKSSIESVKLSPHLTKINNCAFAFCSNLSHIEIPENSELEIIDVEAFGETAIESFIVPCHLTKIVGYTFSGCKKLQKVEVPSNCDLELIESLSILSQKVELANGWCMETPKLTKIRITPASSRYSYLNNKFLLAKSSPESDCYDVLLFARRDVSEVVIPSFIRKIGSFAFNNCEFIKSIEVPEDSKLEIIEKHAFYNSSIEAITIPANVSDLREKWCSGTSKLTSITISPSNKFYKYLNDAYIMSEMSPESGTFDVLHFARRDIKEAIIPKDVKMIDANAFDCCKQLNHVEIPVDSVLQEIGKFAFFCSSIETFFISPHITKICKGAFSDCNSLSRFEIRSLIQLVAMYSLSHP